MNIVLLGAPGSGKGTQAELLAKDFKLFYFQAGELSRELAKKSPRINKIVSSGELIPEEEMSMYVIDYLCKKNFSSNILFEGFPRFISQYEALEKFLQTNGQNIDIAIFLDVSQEKAIDRISSRRICSKCGEVYNLITNPPPEPNKCKCKGSLTLRNDDKPSSVKVRFENFRNNTQKLIDYLDKKGKLVKVNGERPIDVIYEDIKQKLKERGLV